MAQPLLLALTIEHEEREKYLNKIKFWNYNISKGLLIGFRKKLWNWEFKTKIKQIIQFKCSSEIKNMANFVWLTIRHNIL
jgi:hypothetical protein